MSPVFFNLMYNYNILDRGGVIICDNYDHDSQAHGYDACTYAPWVVVLPQFFESGATTKQRARLEKGTMHPKLQLLEFDGGTVSRLAPSSPSTGLVTGLSSRPLPAPPCLC
jgi:hypothetical protein